MGDRSRRCPNHGGKVKSKTDGTQSDAGGVNLVKRPDLVFENQLSMLALRENLSRRSSVALHLRGQNPRIRPSARSVNPVNQRNLFRQLRSLTMVIFQDAAEPLAAIDDSIVATCFITRIDERVGQPLMVALLVITSDEFSHGVAQ